MMVIKNIQHQEELVLIHNAYNMYNIIVSTVQIGVQFVF